MGVDIAKERAKSFNKALDKSRADLCTPGLFTNSPTAVRRRYAATLNQNQQITLGEELGARLIGNEVLLLRGLEPVAKLNAPPAELIAALEASHGDACAYVRDIDTIFGKSLEVELC